MRAGTMQHKIAEFVRSNPGQRLTDIAAEFGDGRNTMAARLRCLVQYGHIVKEGSQDQGFRYYPSQVGVEITPMLLITHRWTKDGLGRALAA